MEKMMGSDGYSWSETRPSSWGGQVQGFPGAWHVDSDVREVGALVAVQDCGCCGVTDVLHVKSVEEFDTEWERIGKMLRTHVERAVQRGE